MKKLFKPASLLFNFLCLLVFFVVGIYVAGFIGAGKNQGLAGGAIVLGYGVLFAGIALIASFFATYHIVHKRIVIANWILFVLLLIGYGVTHYRFKKRQAEKEEQPKEIHTKKTTTPVDSEPMAMLSKKEIHDTMNRAFENKTDQSMGMGYFLPNFHEYSVLYFYGELNLEKSLMEHSPIDSITFKRNKYNQFEIATAPPWLVPDILKLDYDMLYFKIESLTQEFAEVIVNEQNKQTSYVSRRAGNTVYWSDFLLGVHSVEFYPNSQEKVQLRPFRPSGTTNTPYEFMRPMRIKGEWMEVVLMDGDFQNVGKGWIQWKRDDKLLIMYNLLS
jgi:hypothetical protein